MMDKEDRMYTNEEADKIIEIIGNLTKECIKFSEELKNIEKKIDVFAGIRPRGYQLASPFERRHAKFSDTEEDDPRILNLSASRY